VVTTKSAGYEVLTVSPERIEPMVGGLVGGTSVDGGPTREQWTVLDAIVTHFWECPELDITSVRPLSASEVADALSNENDRTLFHEFHVALEACRHPQTAAQVEKVQAYSNALNVRGDDLVMFRDLVSNGVEVAARDYERFLTANLSDRAEPSLPTERPGPARKERELSKLLRRWSDLPSGSLGRAYLSFYEKFGLSLPGEEVSTDHHFFVAHDMTHTIAGLSTTPLAEVALSAFQFGMNNNRINRGALLASLVAHEAGFAVPAHLKQADSGLLADASAAAFFANEMRRGAGCTNDFSLIDHVALASKPLDWIRAEFGVRAPDQIDNEHHWW